jgi:hypothetical protein
MWESEVGNDQKFAAMFIGRRRSIRHWPLPPPST